jgi:hypothetical protein
MQTRNASSGTGFLGGTVSVVAFSERLSACLLLHRRLAQTRLTAKAILCVFATGGALCGCSSERIVEGRMLHASETFSGTAADGWGTGGSLTITSSKGTKCVGRYVKAEAINSSVAVMNCDDGRAGSVMFLDGAHESIGTGMLGKDIVTLTIE